VALAISSATRPQASSHANVALHLQRGRLGTLHAQEKVRH